MNHEYNGKTEVNKKRKNGEFNCFPGRVGTVSPSSPSSWNNSIRTGRDDSYESNTTAINIGETIPGGIARQLMEQAQKQLAYHKQQVVDLEDRIQELQQFTESLNEKESE